MRKLNPIGAFKAGAIGVLANGYMVFALVAAVALSGCHAPSLLSKRESELCCPTDIRQTIACCAGEDAVFHCPCQPDAQFHGYKPTCWRPWPAPGAVWRDMYCNCVGGPGEFVGPQDFSSEVISLPPVEPTPADPEYAPHQSRATPHDYRSRPGVELVQPTSLGPAAR